MASPTIPISFLLLDGVSINTPVFVYNSTLLIEVFFRNWSKSPLLSSIRVSVKSAIKFLVYSSSAAFRLLE